jgi:hypothetical protein
VIKWFCILMGFGFLNIAPCWVTEKRDMVAACILVFSGLMFIAASGFAIAGKLEKPASAEPGAEGE